MSRTLNDDFEDDDPPGGALDLERGSAVGSGAQSNYGGDGIDFDDELSGEDGPAGELELDLPPSSRRSAPPPAAQPPPSPPQRSTSSAALPAARPPSGRHPAFDAPAPRPFPGAPPSEGGHHGFAPAPSSSDAGLRPSDSSARLLAAPESPRNAPPVQEAAEPPRPTGAALIAKYPPPPLGIVHAPMYAVRVLLRQLELRSDLESLRRRRSPDVALYESALRAYDGKTFRLGVAINCAVLTVATFLFFLPVILRFMRD